MKYNFYKIYNDVNDKVYVGITTRTLNQRKDANWRGYSRCPKLWNAIQCYGGDKFHYELLDVIELQTDKEAEEIEEKFQREYDSVENGYNCKYGGANSPQTEDAKRKISDAAKGNQRWVNRKHTDESRANMSEAQKGNQNWLGKQHTEETKVKMSKAQKGNQNNLGHKRSEETKRKMSESNKGKKRSDEAKKKMSVAQKGRKHTDESKKKMSETRKRKHQEKFALELQKSAKITE